MVFRDKGEMLDNLDRIFDEVRRTILLVVWSRVPGDVQQELMEAALELAQGKYQDLELMEAAGARAQPLGLLFDQRGQIDLSGLRPRHFEAAMICSRCL